MNPIRNPRGIGKTSWPRPNYDVPQDRYIRHFATVRRPPEHCSRWTSTRPPVCVSVTKLFETDSMKIIGTETPCTWYHSATTPSKPTWSCPGSPELAVRHYRPVLFTSESHFHVSTCDRRVRVWEGLERVMPTTMSLNMTDIEEGIWWFGLAFVWMGVRTYMSSTGVRWQLQGIRMKFCIPLWDLSPVCGARFHTDAGQCPTTYRQSRHGVPGPGSDQWSEACFPSSEPATNCSDPYWVTEALREEWVTIYQGSIRHLTGAYPVSGWAYQLLRSVWSIFTHIQDCHILALLDYVSRAHGIAICPSSVVRPSVSQLSLNLSHGFLSNFSCGLPWAIL